MLQTRPARFWAHSRIRQFAARALFATVLASAALASAVTTPSADPLSPHSGKVVLVDFWASWCAPCRSSFPWMNDMQTKYADDGLVIVAVNVDNDREAALKFLDEHPPEFEVHYDADRVLARRFEVVAMPSSFLLDRDGRIVDRHLGFKVLQQDEYEAAIRAALGRE
ncbi:MAG TPA: TlpA disulfide reductase family protein [Woeseiaceae bacterium]|nr:TlpA disulfide reductase family protein [Woeseiaceae bacterium]